MSDNIDRTIARYDDGQKLMDEKVNKEQSLNNSISNRDNADHITAKHLHDPEYKVNHSSLIEKFDKILESQHRQFERRVQQENRLQALEYSISNGKNKIERIKVKYAFEIDKIAEESKINVIPKTIMPKANAHQNNIGVILSDNGCEQNAKPSQGNNTILRC